MGRPTSVAIAASIVATLATAPTAQVYAEEPIPAAVLEEADAAAQRAGSDMDNLLKDFPSARVRDVRATYSIRIKGGAERLTFCGEINAKNGMGGYTGWKRFAFLPGDEPGIVIAGGSNFDREVVKRFCDNGLQRWLPTDFTVAFSPPDE